MGQCDNFGAGGPDDGHYRPRIMLAVAAVVAPQNSAARPVYHYARDPH